MKHIKKLLLPIIICSLLIPFSKTISTSAVVDSWAVVTIPDRNLKSKIVDALNYNSNTKKTCDSDITKADMESLDTLSLSYTHINSLEGLQYCKNLKSLYLKECCGLTDISSISNLTNLNTLDLSGNDIKDYTPISNLTGLIDLDY